MAKKKTTKKTKRVKLSTPLIIILILILAIVIGVFGFFYYKASKALAEVNVSIGEIEQDNQTITFNVLVSGDCDAYDVYANSSSDTIVIAEDEGISSSEKSYSYTFTAYDTYEIGVSVYKKILGFYSVSKDFACQSVTIKYNPSEACEGVIYDDFQIHFMTLGNSSAGDSIYIKAGDSDILIDAGSEVGSFDTTSAYINNYCTDGKIEYVIATHGDKDHIAAFPKFVDAYEIGTIITNEHTTKETNTYNNMLAAFESEVSNGAKWYYAADCWNNTNGASRDYELSDNVVMHVVYNYYYFCDESSDENDYSVCTLFEYKANGESKYFFLGGDLEKKGENKMVEFYDGSTEEKTMPKVELYKAGHHGSNTSSNTAFLEMLKPSVCVVCCCCGTNEYTIDYTNQFPTQQFINRIALWTDAVYATSVWDETLNSFKDLNGNVIVSAGLDDEGKASYAVAASNNLIKLKDTEWFNETIYVTNYEEATSTDNQNTKSVPHGNNSASKKDYTFYTSTTEGAVAVPRRTWPQL